MHLYAFVVVTTVVRGLMDCYVIYEIMKLPIRHFYEELCHGYLLNWYIRTWLLEFNRAVSAIDVFVVNFLSCC